MINGLDTINIFILGVVMVNAFLGLFVFITKRDSKVNQSFFVFSIAATLWSLSMFFFRSMAGTSNAIFFARILYASAACIPFAFIFFINFFPEEKYNIPKKFDILLVIPFVFIVLISILPNQLITNILNPEGEQVIVFHKNLHFIYAFYIVSYFSICYSLLFIKYLKFKDIAKQQIMYVAIGTLVSTLIGVTTNLLMPLLGDFRLNWLGQIGIIAMIGMIAYSILKHKLFNTKVIASQLVVFILCASLFVRILFSTDSRDLTINVIFLFISIVTGILLIKSVLTEVEQKERAEDLATDLEATNERLAVANEKLKEVDKLKSEFLSLATHQIRAPLTAIKGYASLILEKDYGEVPAPIESAVKTIFDSCQNLVVIVNDFLDISRIEQGRMKYEMVDVDLVKVCRDIVDQLKPNIESAGLYIKMDTNKEQVIVNADSSKIKQVIGNLVDNCIKYTKQGGINVSVDAREKDVVVSIKDTGIGISKEDISKLFGKFVRAKDASKTNVIGTGLGLYIAKQMIEAHSGSVWVESEGLDKGSTFFVKLPVKK
jgi:signal transduction histidine kinase